jgi:hypothetical protein
MPTSTSSTSTRVKVRGYLRDPLSRSLLLGFINNPSRQLHRNHRKMQKVQEVLGKVTGGHLGTKLPTAKLGKNGPPLTRLGYGTMGLVRGNIRVQSLLDRADRNEE